MPVDVTRTIQVAVVWADMILCRVSTWPWKRMGVSLLLAWWVIHVIKAVKHDG